MERKDAANSGIWQEKKERRNKVKKNSKAPGEKAGKRCAEAQMRDKIDEMEWIGS